MNTEQLDASEPGTAEQHPQVLSHDVFKGAIETLRDLMREASDQPRDRIRLDAARLAIETFFWTCEPDVAKHLDFCYPADDPPFAS